MTLREFLLARIAEDQDLAEYAGDTNGYVSGSQWVAECEAKRQIIALDECTACAVEGQPCELEQVRKLLALPYASHRDYQSEWRP